MAQQTEILVAAALKKIGRNKEKDLCKYLPGGEIGYMHHFTLQKIKKNKPEEFHALLQEFILDPPTPRTIDPKPRARRKKVLESTQIDMKLILKLAQKTGDKYLLSKLSSQLSMPRIKKELIRSIRMGKIEEELWQAYVHSLDTRVTQCDGET
jgi:hypothetical protein